MSGEISVRKRKAKGKKKGNITKIIRDEPISSSEIESEEVVVEKETNGHLLQDPESDFEDISMKPKRSKLLILLQAVVMIVLIGLIYLQLNPNVTSFIFDAKKSQVEEILLSSSQVRDIEAEITPHATSDEKLSHQVDDGKLKEIEKQVLSDQEIADKEATVKEVDVEIPDEITSVPAQEPPFIKESAIKLGDNEVKPAETVVDDSAAIKKRSIVKENEPKESEPMNKNLESDDASSKKTTDRSKESSDKVVGTKPMKTSQTPKKTDKTLEKEKSENHPKEETLKTPTTTPPVVPEKASSPVVTKEATPPVVSKESPPVVSKESTPPVVSKESTPVVSKESTPPVVSKESTPPVVLKESTPVVSKESTPPVLSKEATPPAASKEATPSVALKKSTPPVVSKEDIPAVSIEDTPAVSKEDSSAPSSKESTITAPKTSSDSAKAPRSSKKRRSSKLTPEEIEVQTNLLVRGEKLMEAILKLSPDNYIVSELRPHLDGAKRDLAAGNIKSPEDTTIKHVILILEDVYVRLEEKKNYPPAAPATAVDPKEKEIGSDKQDDNKESVDVKSPQKKDLSLESAPSELSASESDIKLSDLTDEDKGSPASPQLRKAEALIEKFPQKALDVLSSIDSASVRVLLGKATCLDKLAEIERSNDRLDLSIATYKDILDVCDSDDMACTDRLFRAVGNVLVDKMRFRGRLTACSKVQKRLVARFPDEAPLLNQLGITYLLLEKPLAAEEVFKSVLKKSPQDGVAKTHLGFILKTTHNILPEAISLLTEGIRTNHQGTSDVRFYFHLGDALQREGRRGEAYKIYEEGAAKGLFLSPQQRSTYNVDRLKSTPVWTKKQTTYEDFFHILETNWKTIRKEGRALMRKGFSPESEKLQDKGSWGQIELLTRGKENAGNCALAPVTCALVQQFAPAKTCRRGQTKFSLMTGGTHVFPHCGPTNCRLRAHLGLIVKEREKMGLRVADEKITWEEGKVLVFDDSYEHEVWHNGTSDRLVLIVDLWHPQLTDKERKTLTAV